MDSQTANIVQEFSCKKSSRKISKKKRFARNQILVFKKWLNWVKKNEWTGMLDLVQSICSSLLCMYAKQSEYREDEHDRNRIYLNLLKKLCSFRCILWLGLAWVGLRIHPTLNNFVIFFSIFSLFSSLHVVWSLNRNGLIAKESKCAAKKEGKKNNRGRRRHCCLHKSLCTLRLDISAYSSVSQIPYRKRELKKGQNHREHLRVSCLNIMALMRLWLSCTAAFFSVLIIKHLSSLMLLLAFNLNTQVN